MINLKDYIESSKDLFKQFKVDDMLFVEYVCFVQEELTNIWAHNNYFVFTLKGKKGIKSLDKEHHLSEGDLIFVKKGAHTTHQFFDERYYCILIFISDEFIRSVIHDNQVRPTTQEAPESFGNVYTLKTDDVLSSYFYSVLSYFSKEEAPSRVLLKKKFEELIINILVSRRNPALANYMYGLYINSKISIREIMESNFPYNMKLDEFARLAGRSLSTFRRDFKKLYGTSPSKWLTQRRLEYARYLLESTDKNINEITFEVGFEHPSHFIRVFKDHYQTTPMQYKATN